MSSLKRKNKIKHNNDNNNNNNNVDDVEKQSSSKKRKFNYNDKIKIKKEDDDDEDEDLFGSRSDNDDVEDNIMDIDNDIKINIKSEQIDEIKNNVLKYNTTPISNVNKFNNLNTIVPHRKRPPNRMKMEESVLLFKKNQNVNFIKNINDDHNGKHINTMEDIIEDNRKPRKEIIVLPIESFLPTNSTINKINGIIKKKKVQNKSSNIKKISSTIIVNNNNNSINSIENGINSIKISESDLKNNQEDVNKLIDSVIGYIYSNTSPLEKNTKNFDRDIKDIEVVNIDHINNNLKIYEESILKLKFNVHPCVSKFCLFNDIKRKHPLCEIQIKGCAYITMKEYEKIYSILDSKQQESFKIKNVNDILDETKDRICEICYRHFIYKTYIINKINNTVPTIEIANRYYLNGSNGWLTSGFITNDINLNQTQNNGHNGKTGYERKYNSSDFLPVIYEMDTYGLKIISTYEIESKIDDIEKKNICYGYKEIKHIYHLNEQVIFNFNQIGNNSLTVNYQSNFYNNTHRNSIDDCYSKITIDNILYYQIENYTNVDPYLDCRDIFLDLTKCIMGDVYWKKYIPHFTDNIKYYKTIIDNNMDLKNNKIFLVLNIKIKLIDIMINNGKLKKSILKFLEKYLQKLEKKLQYTSKKKNEFTISKYTDDEIFSNNDHHYNLISHNCNCYEFIMTEEYIKEFDRNCKKFYFGGHSLIDSIVYGIKQINVDNSYKKVELIELIKSIDKDKNKILEKKDIQFINTVKNYIKLLISVYEKYVIFVCINNLSNEEIKSLDTSDCFSLEKEKIYEINQKLDLKYDNTDFNLFDDNDDNSNDDGSVYDNNKNINNEQFELNNNNNNKNESNYNDNYISIEELMDIRLKFIKERSKITNRSKKKYNINKIDYENENKDKKKDGDFSDTFPKENRNFKFTYYDNLFNHHDIQNYLDDKEKIAHRGKVYNNRKNKRSRQNELNKLIFIEICKKIESVFNNILNKINHQINIIKVLINDDSLMDTYHDILNNSKLLDSNKIKNIILDNNFFISIIPNVNNNKSIEFSDNAANNFNINVNSINNFYWNDRKILLLVLEKISKIQKFIKYIILDNDLIYNLKKYQCSHLNLINYFIKNPQNIPSDNKFQNFINNNLVYNEKHFEFNPSNVVTFENMPDLSHLFTDLTYIEHNNLITNPFIQLNFKLIERSSESKQYLSKLKKICLEDEFVKKYIINLFNFCLKGLFPEINEVVNFDKIILYEELFDKVYDDNDLFDKLFDFILNCTKFAADVIIFGFYQFVINSGPFVDIMIENYENWSPENIISNINLSIYLLNNNFLNSTIIQKNIYDNPDIRRFKKINKLFSKHNFLEFINSKFQIYEKTRNSRKNENNHLSYQEIHNINLFITRLDNKKKIPLNLLEVFGIKKEVIEILEQMKLQYDNINKKIELQKLNNNNNINNDESDDFDYNYFIIDIKTRKDIDNIKKIDEISSNQYLLVRLFFKLYYNYTKISCTKIVNKKFIKNQIKVLNELHDVEDVLDVKENIGVLYICLKCMNIKNVFSDEKKFEIGNDLLYVDLFNKKIICDCPKKKNKHRSNILNIRKRIKNNDSEKQLKQITNEYRKKDNNVTEKCSTFPVIKLNMIGNILTIPNCSFYNQGSTLNYIDLKLASFIICPTCGRFTVLDYKKFSNNSYNCGLPKYNSLDDKIKNYSCFTCKRTLNSKNEYNVIQIYDDIEQHRIISNCFCLNCLKNLRKYKRYYNNSVLKLSQLNYIMQNNLNYEHITNCEEIYNGIIKNKIIKKFKKFFNDINKKENQSLFNVNDEKANNLVEQLIDTDVFNLLRCEKTIDSDFIRKEGFEVLKQIYNYDASIKK